MALYGTVPPFQDPEIPIEQPFDNLQVLSSSRQPTDQSLGWWLSDGVCIFVLPFLEFIINLDDESLQFWQLFSGNSMLKKGFFPAFFGELVFFCADSAEKLGTTESKFQGHLRWTVRGGAREQVRERFTEGWRGKEVVTVILAEYRGWKSSNVWFTLIQCG